MSKSVKRVVKIKDSKTTSIQLEASEWKALEGISRRENIKRNELITLIDTYRGNGCLAPAIRLFTIRYYHQLASRIKAGTTQHQNLRNVLRILDDIKDVG